MIVNNSYVNTQYEPGTKPVFTESLQQYEGGTGSSVDKETKARRTGS